MSPRTAREKLIERCDGVDFDAMTPGSYAAWVNGLPMDEFAALLATHDEYREGAVSLPFANWHPPSREALASINSLLEIEEHVLRLLDEVAADQALKVDPRWYAIGRTDIEKGFSDVVRAIFKPQRLELDGPATPEPEIGWVLEREDSPISAPLYYAPSGHHGDQWSNDHEKALRFSREIDASRLGMALAFAVRVCEHQWG